MKYVRNDIVKPFKVKIIRYAERVREMHDLDKYLPPPSMKGESAMAANRNVHNQEFTASDIRLAIKDGLPKSMRDELDDHPEDYRSLTYEDWCDLLSTIKVKDERNRAANQINKIASYRAASLSDSDKSIRIPRKNNARTGFLRSNKSPNKAHKHHGIQHFCVLCNKAGSPKRNYMSHSANYCTGMRTNRTIKYGMGGSVGSRNDTVKQYKKSENKRKKDIKALKKKNNMIYSIANKSGLRREINNIKKIRAKVSKKVSKSPSDDSDYD